ncbi:MAG TPA: FecR domain-containing protein, partial [Opitutaceae bacterium]
ADPRHREALQRLGGAWDILTAPPVVEETDAIPLPTSARRSPTRWLAFGGLAAAAAVAFIIFRSDPAPEPASSTAPGAVASASIAIAPADAARTRELPDGTVVRLNAGAELIERFTPEERRVVLTRGEAYFDVARNAARPFVVEARGAAVRAVGTAFNVDLRAGTVAVLVTEGKVLVAPPDTSHTEATPEVPLVVAGHKAVVPLEKPASGPRVVVVATTPTEIDAVLAWRERLLRLDGVTLTELAQRLSQQTGKKIVIADPALALKRIGGRLPAGDVEAFVRVLETHYGLSARHEADGTIVLGAAQP